MIKQSIHNVISSMTVVIATIQTPDLNAEYFKLCGNGDEEKVSEINNYNVKIIHTF